MKWPALIVPLLAACSSPAVAREAPHVVPPPPSPIVLADPADQAKRERLEEYIALADRMNDSALHQAWHALAAARSTPIGSPDWLAARMAVAASMHSETALFWALEAEALFLRQLRSRSPAAQHDDVDSLLDAIQSEEIGTRDRTISNLRDLAQLPQGDPPSP